MDKIRTTISQADSYLAIGEFWDAHDAGEFWDQTEPAEFAVDLQSVTTYYAVEGHLAERLRMVARQKGVSAETLINLWVQEKSSRAGAWVIGALSSFPGRSAVRQRA